MPEYAPPTDRRGWTVSVLVDAPDSWIMPWAGQLVETISPFHAATLCTRQEDVPEGDFCFLLGCLTRMKDEVLARNELNLVVHESGLPKGRGWSPVAWQVLKGASSIPVCLFQAVSEVDAGPVFLRDDMDLDGTELLPEIRAKQGAKTVELCLRFLLARPDLEPIPQTGEPTFYRKRTVADDRLDETRSLAENFNHLRIVDNDAYPAWFEHGGRRFIVKIYPDDDGRHPDKDKKEG